MAIQALEVIEAALQVIEVVIVAVTTVFVEEVRTLNSTIFRRIFLIFF